MATQADVYMDIPQVEEMIKKFKAFQSTLTGIANFLKGLETLATVAALVGGFGAAAVQMLRTLQQNTQAMANKMGELANDVTGALKAYRDGDLTGSQKFVG